MLRPRRACDEPAERRGLGEECGGVDRPGPPAPAPPRHCRDGVQDHHAARTQTGHIVHIKEAKAVYRTGFS